MVLILVHWLIRKGSEEVFEKHWLNMSVKKGIGLFREILTTPDRNIFDPKFQTFHIESPHYSTYLNIGIWKSLRDFDVAINKYFPKATSETTGGITTQNIELNEFEFKLRERIVLRKVADRGINLPKADIEE